MNPIVNIILTDGKEIKVELMPEYAPISVANFLKLVDEKFYDGVVFHRIIQNFMIQTGGYYIEDMTLNDKEEKETIKGEFASNGVENNLKHTAGVISMARTMIKDSASSQFFICSVDCPHLDGEYAAFGKCVDEESLKNVIEVSNVETARLSPQFTDFPCNLIAIKTIERIQ